MHLRKALALASVAAVALLGATAAQPSAGLTGVRMLRTVTPVSMAADGSRVFVSTGCVIHEDQVLHQYQLLAWNPLRRSVVSVAPRRQRRCYGASTGEGVWEQAIAGSRLAWVRFYGGNTREEWLITGTIGRPRSTTPLTGRASHETGSGLGDWVGNVHGDGGLLVFNTWSVCDTESTFEPCPEGVPSGIYDENLWRIVGRHKRLLVASRDEMTVLSVAADRILVQRADGSLELRGADGSLLRAFPFQTGEVRAALLDSSELVVLDRESGLHWRVYDPASGEQKQVFPAVARMASADVERGLLVYTVGWGRFVHVLRLVDGRRTHFTAPMVRSPHEDPVPVLAQIEPSGLFYSYQVRSKGRVRFVPFNQIGLGG